VVKGGESLFIYPVYCNFKLQNVGCISLITTTCWVYSKVIKTAQIAKPFVKCEVKINYAYIVISMGMTW